MQGDPWELRYDLSDDGDSVCSSASGTPVETPAAGVDGNVELAVPRLPPELLATVFRALDALLARLRIRHRQREGGPPTAAALGRLWQVQGDLRLVCRLWRNLIEGDPTLWTVVHLYGERGRAGLLAGLERSRGDLLDVRLCYRAPYHNPTLAPLALTFRELTAHAHRIRLLELDLIVVMTVGQADSPLPPDDEGLNALATLAAADLSRLEVLLVDGHVALPAALLGRALRDVRISNVVAIEPAPWSLSCALTRLHLRCVLGTASLVFLFDALRALKRLDTLHLEGHSLDDALAGATGREIIVLPELRRLAVLAHPLSMQRILEVLNAPKLEGVSLDVRCEGRDVHRPGFTSVGSGRLMLSAMLTVFRRRRPSSSGSGCSLRLGLARLEIRSEGNALLAQVACSGRSCRAGCQLDFHQLAMDALSTYPELGEAASSLAFDGARLPGSAPDWKDSLAHAANVTTVVLLGSRPHVELLDALRRSATLPALKTVFFANGCVSESEARAARGLLARVSTAPGGDEPQRPLPLPRVRSETTSNGSLSFSLE